MSQSMPLAPSQNIEKSEDSMDPIFLASQEIIMTDEDQDQHEQKNDAKKEVSSIKGNSQLDDFLKKFEEASNPEDKVHIAIEFMRFSLSQTGSPFFKGFWEARKLCLPFFKEINSPVRAQFWNEYIELTKEGRRLKTLLDEESAFAVEQIEMAINALDQEVLLFETERSSLIEKTNRVEFFLESQTLKNKQHVYIEIQEQLNILNTFASRINALRKELIKTEIRIRQKNKFFQRLSSIGDRVFPKRKDLIKEISELFLQDVEKFVADNFSSHNSSKEALQRSLFFFREEIKALQSIAKILTLNTHSFSTTREQLSNAWDQLKGMEKEIRKEVAQQRAAYRQNVDQVRLKFKEFSDAYAQGQMSLNDAFKQLEEVVAFMRQIPLGKEDVRQLREELKEIKKPILEQSEKEESERREKEQAIEQEKREKNLVIKNRIEQLQQKIETQDIEESIRERDALIGDINNSSMTKGEKQILERSLKRIRDLIAERKEKEVVELSEDDRNSIDQLQMVLNQRKERRNEIKSQIEEYRKLIGSSGLDFEKAMTYNELMAVEKERLEKINEGIQEIETKLSGIKRK